MSCLNKKHICHLVSALREDESLWTLVVKEALNPLGDNLDSEMYLANPLFTELLDNRIQALATEQDLRKTRASNEVTGAGSVEANGTYVYEEQGRSCRCTKRTSPPSQEASHFICRYNTGLDVNTGLTDFNWIIFLVRGPPYRDAIPVPADNIVIKPLCFLSNLVAKSIRHSQLCKVLPRFIRSCTLSIL